MQHADHTVFIPTLVLTKIKAINDLEHYSKHLDVPTMDIDACLSAIFEKVGICYKRCVTGVVSTNIGQVALTKAIDQATEDLVYSDLLVSNSQFSKQKLYLLVHSCISALVIQLWEINFPLEGLLDIRYQCRQRNHGGIVLRPVYEVGSYHLWRRTYGIA